MSEGAQVVRLDHSAARECCDVGLDGITGDRFLHSAGDRSLAGDGAAGVTGGTPAMSRSAVLATGRSPKPSSAPPSAWANPQRDYSTPGTCGTSSKTPSATFASGESGSRTGSNSTTHSIERPTTLMPSGITPLTSPRPRDFGLLTAAANP